MPVAHRPSRLSRRRAGHAQACSDASRFATGNVDALATPIRFGVLGSAICDLRSPTTASAPHGLVVVGEHTRASDAPTRELEIPVPLLLAVGSPWVITHSIPPMR